MEAIVYCWCPWRSKEVRLKDAYRWPNWGCFRIVYATQEQQMAGKGD